MNGSLKRRATAIYEGKYLADDSEKLDVLLGLTLDVHEVVSGEGGHEERLGVLEVYPQTLRRVAKLLIGLGALAGAVVAIAALAG
ncbi:hypothetical protein LCGC14_0490950 [marine sediment metagenome]|uniref:Uncharacterized protein n=1 Tax=marine sediment metagenome TaxID=412755 RepID=A0A0F9SPW5_9ZZZZ